MTGWTLLQWLSGLAVLLSVLLIWLSSNEKPAVFAVFFVVGMAACGLAVTVVLEA